MKPDKWTPKSNGEAAYSEFSHKSVMLQECLDALNVKEDGIYVDGTLGGAGHSMAIYKRLGPKGMLVGIDQDEFALKTASERLKSINGQGRLLFENKNFSRIEEICADHGILSVDGILMDLGVSSHQLDEGERGFSYQKDAPLDMRMDRKAGLDAGGIVNQYSEDEIKRIIQDYGEEKWAARIAAFIIRARAEKKIETTLELVDIIKAAIPSAARRDGPHPAKRTFQALRIAVNNELGILKETIEGGIRLLKPGGRFAIITFHSLEDRIVKNEFGRAAKPCECPPKLPVCICGKKPSVIPVMKKPLTPSENELDENPRARSAKLRAVEKLP